MCKRGAAKSSESLNFPSSFQPGNLPNPSCIVPFCVHVVPGIFASVWRKELRLDVVEIGGSTCVQFCDDTIRISLKIEVSVVAKKPKMPHGISSFPRECNGA